MSNPQAAIKSIYPDIEIPSCSLFDFLLPPATGELHKPAFIDAVTGTQLTYAQLRSKSLELANGLRKLHNIKKFDTVLIISPNSLSYPVLILGTSAAGAKLSLANPAYNHFELSHQLKDSNATLVFAHPDNIALTKKILKEIGWSDAQIAHKLISASESDADGHAPYTRILDSAPQPGVPEKFDGENSHETAVMCYSSGTTGLSKGVMTSHNNIVANICQLTSMRGYILQKGDVMLSVLVSLYIKSLKHPLTCI